MAVAVETLRSSLEVTTWIDAGESVTFSCVFDAEMTTGFRLTPGAREMSNMVAWPLATVMPEMVWSTYPT